MLTNLGTILVFLSFFSGKKIFKGLGVKVEGKNIYKAKSESDKSLYVGRILRCPPIFPVPGVHTLHNPQDCEFNVLLLLGDAIWYH